MWKNKELILILILFSNCFVKKDLEKQHSYFGKYFYQNEINTLSIEINLFEDNSFTFIKENGLDKKYSKGIYMIFDNYILMNSVYTDTLQSIPLVSWVDFSDEKLKIEKKKIIYKGFFLKKE